MILVQKFELGHISTSINHVHFMVIVRRRKKRDYVGKIPRWRTPPSPPVWETPVIKKKLGLFFILQPQQHFWSSPGNHNFK